MPERSAPVGVFDSGVGGLSVIKALVERLPHEDYIYLGDTARLPYGTKAKSTIVRFSIENAEFLLSKGVKLIVVACNSASATALDALRARFDVPIVGVIRPGAEAAVQATTSGSIGVIGTEATINSGCYEQEILRLRPAAHVLGKPCPLFVPLVEEGWLDDPITRQVAERYLSAFRAPRVDVLILGCTHYPLLAGVIADVVGPQTAIVDSASTVAAAVEGLLLRMSLANDTNSPGTHRFYVTDLPAKVKRIGRMFLGIDDLSIELVRLGSN